MSHPRKPLSSSSGSWDPSSYKAGPDFFRSGFAVSLMRDSRGHDETIFKFLDMRSKAKLARTSRLFFSIPEYQTAIPDFNKIVKAFFKFVLDGKEGSVLLMLNMYPELHFATAEFIDALTGERFKRTAYQLALASEDVGREGCDVCLCSNPNEVTSLEKLALYSDGDNLTPFRYRAQGREWTIERGTGPDQLSPAHFATLKAMYANPSLLQPTLLNLSHKDLTQVQQQAYSALLKITSSEERKHTLFVKEEGLAQAIAQSTKAQPGGELEITRATNEQFLEGWEEQEKERAARELKALKDVVKAICDSQTNQDCTAAFNTFRNLVKPRITKTGKHFNGQLLALACKLWESKFWNASPYNSRQSNLFLDEVLGYIERIAPANYRQAIAQGLQPILELGEKLKRSFKARYGCVSLDGRSGDFWIDILGAGARGLRALGLGWPALRRTAGVQFFSKLCSGKNSIVAKYYATARIARSEPFERPLHNPVTFRNSPSAMAASDNSQQDRINNSSSSSYV